MKPNYYGILPAKIRYDKRLKPMEKILYTEITALANVQGFCFASNSYFAELYEVHKNTVGVWINKLIEFGYIKAQIIYKQDSKEVLERRLYIIDLQTLDEIEEDIDPINKKVDTLSTKSLIPYQRKDCHPINEIIEDNTTRDNIIKVNNTSNTTTKLDKINKIEKIEASSDSSSFVLEKSDKNYKNSEEELENNSSSLSTGNIERDREISQMILILFEYGVKDKTIENIVKLDVSLERVNEVLKVAKNKSWGDGAIYKALKENWVVDEKKENTISDEELEAKKRWLNYFAGLDKGNRGEILELIKSISMEKLDKNKKKLARTGSIFEFKQELKRLLNN